MTKKDKIETLTIRSKRCWEAVQAARQKQQDATVDYLTGVREFGESLIAVKEATPHGGFMKWVEAYFPLSYNTASDYMLVANEWNDDILPKINPFLRLNAHVYRFFGHTYPRPRVLDIRETPVYVRAKLGISFGVISVVFAPLLIRGIQIALDNLAIPGCVHL